MDVNKANQETVNTRSADYVVLHEELEEIDTEIKALFEKHPEWRGETKSVKTPYGAVEQRTVTELEVPNPTMTVALIKARGKADPNFKSEAFLHIEEEPNLEALEGLSNDELSKLGVNRKQSERITVKAAKVNVAKAVKAASKKKESK